MFEIKGMGAPGATKPGTFASQISDRHCGVDCVHVETNMSMRTKKDQKD
jgi:adenylate kinase family enzyme